MIAAAHEGLDRDVLGYTTATGLMALRRRVATHYGDWYGVEVDPESVMLTVGASGAFVAAFLAAFDAGDRVAVPSPGYPCYRNALTALGVEVVDVPTTMETRFQPTVEMLEQVGRVDGLVLGSPSNPTGTMLDHSRMGGGDPVVSRQRRVVRFRRDLPRHHLWRGGSHCVAIRQRRHRDQQLLQIFFDDGLAPRVDRDTRGTA